MNKMALQESTNNQEEWDLIISPQRNWWDLRLGELWRYRDLIRLFVWRDFVAYYKQTILGPLWYVIQPILTTLVFTVIFGNIAQLSTDGLPPFLFYLAGNTVWSYFSACLVNTSNTFTTNAGIFGKVYFPRLSIPISVVISNLISFSIRLVLFIAFWIYFLVRGAEFQPNWWILILPVLVLMMGGMGLGLGIIVSSMTSKYRDLQHLISFGVQLLMYATPIIYPLSSVQGVWRWLLLVNPMTPIIEIFRLAFLGTSSLEPIYMIYSVVFTVIVFCVGVLIFNRVETTFMDTV
jgi:lipopolysaccharide transport system permease protein